MRTIAQLLTEEMETNEPQDTILKTLKENEGKRIDKRLLDKLKTATGLTDLHYSSIASMTHLERNTNNKERFSMLLYYHSQGNMVDSQAIEKQNVCMFSAKDERNKERCKLLNDPDLKDAQEIVDNLAKLLKQLKVMVQYGEFLSPVRYSIQRELGLTDRNGGTIL